MDPVFCFPGGYFQLVNASALKINISDDYSVFLSSLNRAQMCCVVSRRGLQLPGRAHRARDRCGRADAVRASPGAERSASDLQRHRVCQAGPEHLPDPGRQGIDRHWGDRVVDAGGRVEEVVGVLSPPLCVDTRGGSRKGVLGCRLPPHVCEVEG